MKLSLDALLVLDAIERRGSFGAAAIELHRVPSAITYQVQKLESDLDIALFNRSGHRAKLTAAGRELLDAGRLLLRAAGELEHRVRRVATGWEAELRIAVDSAVPLALLWPLLAGFYADCLARAAGTTRIKLSREVLGGAWDALMEGRADLVIGAPGDPPGGGGYRQRPLAEFRLVFAVAPAHPLAKQREPIPTQVILEHRAVVAADSSRRLAPRTVGLFDGQDTLTVPDLDAKIAAQVAGLGCGFVPWHLAQAEIAAGLLVIKRVEEIPPPPRLSIAWRMERPGKALQWWIDAVTRSGLAEALAAGAKRDTAPAARRTRRRH